MTSRLKNYSNSINPHLNKSDILFTKLGNSSRREKLLMFHGALKICKKLTSNKEELTLMTFISLLWTPIHGLLRAISMKWMLK